MTFFSQSQNKWQFGLTIGTANNFSYFSGGNSEADARFNHAPTITPLLLLNVRKQLSEHWSAQTGFGITTFGFSYSLAQNYSLLTQSSNNSLVSYSSNSVLFIPATLVYNTKLNCKNRRWFIGAGIAGAFNGQSNYEESMVEGKDVTVDLLLNYNTFYSFTTLHFQCMGGLEKLFRKKQILRFGLIGNFGSNVIAVSQVNYTIDGNSYSHNFANRGSYLGFFVSYFFREIVSKK